MQMPNFMIRKREKTRQRFVALMLKPYAIPDAAVS
jgi:hypothetical protein